MTKHYINDLVLICDDNAHTRAYLNKFLEVGIFPSHVICLKNKIPPNGAIHRFKYRVKEHLPLFHRWYHKFKKLMGVAPYSKENKENSEYAIKLFGRDLYFKTTLEILNEMDITFEKISADDINDPLVINKLEKLSCRYVLISQANILKERILSINKKFFSIHKAILPTIRGRSSSYWPILINKQLYGATVHFIDKGIDTGSIIRKENFIPPQVNTEVQVKLYESHMVSELLVKAIVDLHTKKELNAVAQDMASGTTYFRMHPLLAEVGLSKQLRNQNINKYEIDFKKWIEKLKNNFKMYFRDSKLEFISDVERDEVLRKSLNDESIKNDILKKSFINLLSILEPGYIFNKQDFSSYSKQIDLGWTHLKGVKQSSIVYLLSDTSNVLLNSFLITLYQKSRDLRLLNTSLKLNSVMENVSTKSLGINAYRLMYRVVKEQLKHLNDLRNKST